MDTDESTVHQRIIAAQAVKIDQLQAEVARLQEQLPTASTKASPEPVVRQARKKRTLSSRVKMSLSWTPARRAAASRKMREYWMMEKATRPDHPNGALL
jgi:hypothetical protein